ncbi:hypothetical protein [Micromonospora carbonacea]
MRSRRDGSFAAAPTALSPPPSAVPGGPAAPDDDEFPLTDDH